MKQFLTILVTVLITAFVLVAGNTMFGPGSWTDGEGWSLTSLFSFGREIDPIMSDDELRKFEEALLEWDTQDLVDLDKDSKNGSNENNDSDNLSGNEDRSKKDDIVICNKENQVPKTDTKTGKIICIDADVVETECVWLDGEAYDLWDTKEQFQVAYKTEDEPNPTCKKASFTCVNSLYVSTVEDSETYNRTECVIINGENAEDEDVFCEYKGKEYLPWEVTYNYVSTKVEKTTECRFVWFYCNGNWNRSSSFDKDIYEFEECSFTEALDGEYIESYARDLVERWVLTESDDWDLILDTAFVVQDAGEWCVTPWDEKILHGESVLSFEDETWAFEDECVVRTSLCDNGTFVEKEPFDYPSCKIEVPKSCNVDWYTLLHDTTKTFYNKWRWIGNSYECDTGELYCNDWVVEWDDAFRYTDCSKRVAAPVKKAPVKAPVKSAPAKKYDASQASCPSPFVWWWASWRADQTWVWYSSATVSFWSACQAVNLVCKFGTIRLWSVSNYGASTGQKYHTSCTEWTPTTCSFNYVDAWTISVSHGWTVPYYSTNTVWFWSSCQSKTAVCTNGKLTATSGYKNCSAGKPAACSSPCGSVNHGASLTTYNFASLPYDPNVSSCAAIWNAVVKSTCTNGSLSPAPAAHCSCSVQWPANCSNGMRHGETTTRVNNPGCNADQFGNTLDGWAESQCACKYGSITCTNWRLSKTANYPGDGYPVGSCG